MKSIKMSAVVLLAAFVSLAGAGSSCSKKQGGDEKANEPKIGVERKAAESDPFDPKYAEFNTYQEAKEQSSTYFLSSKTCRKCHDSIYDHWKNSMHSMSFVNPIFEASYYKAYRLENKKAQTFCLKCHAPIGSLDPDFDLKDEVVREGITCDFCHSIKAVDLNAKEKFTMVDDDTKMGPLKDSKSPFHKTAYSPLHQKSELCGGCHNLINENNVEVMGTYNEWKASDYAKKGIQCQNCHMPVLDDSRTVNAQVSDKSHKANSHLLEGGHSEEQLKKAVDVKVADILRKSDGMEVTVKVTNKGAGHKIPTGAPSRSLALNVVLYAIDGNSEITRASRVYKKVLKGKSNMELRDDAEMFLYAHSIQTDDRIAPGETREEVFKFPVASGVNVRVEAELVYQYDPKVFVEQNMRVRMGFDKASSAK